MGLCNCAIMAWTAKDSEIVLFVHFTAVSSGGQAGSEMGGLSPV